MDNNPLTHVRLSVISIVGGVSFFPTGVAGGPDSRLEEASSFLTPPDPLGSPQRDSPEGLQPLVVAALSVAAGRQEVIVHQASQ